MELSCFVGYFFLYSFYPVTCTITRPIVQEFKLMKSKFVVVFQWQVVKVSRDCIISVINVKVKSGVIINL